jgi:hypothetical protein
LLGIAQTLFSAGLAIAALATDGKLRMKIFKGTRTVLNRLFNVAISHCIADTDVHEGSLWSR